MLIVGILILIAGAAYGGYYYGQKNEKKQAAKQVAAAQSAVAANLPAVTPVETLRNFMGNFFFDNNFASNGFQQSASLTVPLINAIISGQSQQISAVQAIFCTNALPVTVSFSTDPLTQFSTNTNVTANQVFKDGSKISATYNMILNNGRWQIDQITCPKSN